jgi:DNA-binding MarR family transcriptional regulator
MHKDVIDYLQKAWAHERPELNPRPMGVVLRIQALAKIMRDMAAKRLDQYGLQWWQYDVLATLRRQGAPFTMSATDLAEESMVSSGAMTNRIDGLEESGLVKREDCADDRRRVMVTLTKKGMKVVELATEARFEMADDALHRLSTTQQRQLSDLLRLLMPGQ